MDLSELGGGICLSPASRESSQTERPPKRYTEIGARTSAVLLRKRVNNLNTSLSQYGSMSKKRRQTSLDLKAKVIRVGNG